MEFNWEIVVEGRVQGVGYRYFARLKANELNLTGYTRNLINGNVLIVAEGNETDLNTFVGLLYQGPARAQVRKINIAKSDFSASYSDFVIH